MGRMKFIVESKSFGPRIGSLFFQQGQGDGAESKEIRYETPAYFIHTQSGSIPHISSDVFQMLFGDQKSCQLPPININIDTTFTFHDVLGESKMNISKFVGLETCPSLLTVSNPLNANSNRSGYNDKLGISLWTRKGRRTLNTDTLNKIIRDYKPNIAQSMSDYDINIKEASSKKRIKKSTERTLDYLDQVLKVNDKSSTEIFATIESGWFTRDGTSTTSTSDEGAKVLAQMKEKILTGGYIIGGVKNQSQSQTDKDQSAGEVEEIDYTQIGGILNQLSNDKPKFIQGPFMPHEIIELILNGSDLFDSSIITKLTDEGKALVLNFPSTSSTNSIPNENLPGGDENVKNEVDKTEVCNILDLKDKKYFSDFSPIMTNCDCIACRKHTRSYIHHLFVTDELLFFVLLMCHNLFHFDRFFNEIRKIMKNGNGVDIKAELVKFKSSVKA